MKGACPSKQNGAPARGQTRATQGDDEMKLTEQCKMGWLDTAAEWDAEDFELSQGICETCPLYATGEQDSCPGIQNLV
jgi:hypothetical protein